MKNTAKTVAEKYKDADAIYFLRRSKVKNTRSKILDTLVCLFTPFVEITETADTISDMGTYFLVIKSGRQLLVRADENDITEKDITGRCEGKKFVIDGNKFIKGAEIKWRKDTMC